MVDYSITDAWLVITFWGFRLIFFKGRLRIFKGKLQYPSQICADMGYGTDLIVLSGDLVDAVRNLFDSKDPSRSARVFKWIRHSHSIT